MDYICEDLVVIYMLEGYVGMIYQLELKELNGKIKFLVVIYVKIKEREVFFVFEEKDVLDLKWYENDIVYLVLNLFLDWNVFM